MLFITSLGDLCLRSDRHIGKQAAAFLAATLKLNRELSLALPTPAHRSTRHREHLRPDSAGARVQALFRVENSGKRTVTRYATSRSADG